MTQVFRGASPVVSAGAGMGMYGGAVAGDGKVFLRNKSACNGRQDGGMVKEKLKARFKVKRDPLPVYEPFLDGFCDLGFSLQCFLFFAFCLLACRAFWRSRKPGGVYPVHISPLLEQSRACP